MKLKNNLRLSSIISQQHLADYLDVSRELVSAHEKQRRVLPIAAITKVTLLHTAIANNKNDFTKVEVAAQKDLLKTYLQQQKNDNALAVVHWQNKLATMKAYYSNALQVLNAIRTLQTQTNNKKDTLWLAATEAICIEKINKNGLVAQQKLIQKIDTLLNA